MQKVSAPPPSAGAIPIAELGQGGMADVHLALRRGVGGFVKLLVLKRLRERYLDEPEFLTMFVDEARLAARLSHTNVVQTHEIAFDGRRWVLEMEYLDGQPLHRIIHRMRRSERPIAPAIARRIVGDVLAGLHYAHELRDYDGTPMNVVHRDVSPHNVFVTYQGVVKLVDFGIAKAVGQLSVTTIGNVKGKPHYMSPEHARGERVDRRADVFAAGVVLHELLTGQRYWSGLSQEAVGCRLATDDLPSGPRAVNPEVPEELDRVVRRATAANQDDRFATADEFRLALEACPADPASTRALGELVAALFASERREVRAIIEAAVERTNGQALLRAPSPEPADKTSTEAVTLAAGPSLPPARARGPRSALVAAIAVAALGVALAAAWRDRGTTSGAGRAYASSASSVAIELGGEPPAEPTNAPHRPAPARARAHNDAVAAPAAPEPQAAVDAGAPLDVAAVNRRRAPPRVDFQDDPWDAGAPRRD